MNQNQIEAFGVVFEGIVDAHNALVDYVLDLEEDVATLQSGYFRTGSLPDGWADVGHVYIAPAPLPKWEPELGEIVAVRWEDDDEWVGSASMDGKDAPEGWVWAEGEGEGGFYIYLYVGVAS